LEGLLKTTLCDPDEGRSAFGWNVEASRGESKGAIAIRSGPSSLRSRKVRETKKLTLGSQIVSLPGPLECLTLVVIRGYSESPLLFLTNLDGLDPDRILEIYLTRWKCEEIYRVIKQACVVEDIRFLSYSGLRSMMALVQAVSLLCKRRIGQLAKDSSVITLHKSLSHTKPYYTPSGR